MVWPRIFTVHRRIQGPLWEMAPRYGQDIHFVIEEQVQNPQSRELLAAPECRLPS